MPVKGRSKLDRLNLLPGMHEGEYLIGKTENTKKIRFIRYGCQNASRSRIRILLVSDRGNLYTQYADFLYQVAWFPIPDRTNPEGYWDVIIRDCEPLKTNKRKNTSKQP